MAIHLTQGGLVLSDASKRPVKRVNVIYDVTLAATVVWKSGVSNV